MKYMHSIIEKGVEPNIKSTLNYNEATGSVSRVPTIKRKISETIDKWNITKSSIHNILRKNLKYKPYKTKTVSCVRCSK